MSTRFLFPCSDCEHQFELVSTEAGRELTCPHCDANLEAPKLGQLKNLPTVESQSPVKPKKSGSNFLATLGLFTALFGGIAGIALNYYASTLITPFDLESNIVEVNGKIDQLSANEVVMLYSSVDTENGLGEWQETSLVRYNTQAEILENISYGLMGLGGVGLLMLIGSFLAKSKA